MVVAVNPVYPVIAAQGVAADITLQPGTVIDARVLKLLANDFVRIAVSNLSIEVMSEVPLQVGQALQLAVSQTQDGVRLQIVPQSAGDAAGSGADTPATIVTTGTGGASNTLSTSASSPRKHAGQCCEHHPSAHNPRSAGGFRSRAKRSGAAGQPVAAVRQSRRRSGVGDFAGAVAAGRSAALVGASRARY